MGILLLTGRMGVAYYIRGLQGDDPHYLKVAATVKHFAVNNVETNRQRLSADVDERNLMEYWLRRIGRAARSWRAMLSR